MTTDPTEAATRARMAERTAFARGARMGSEAEAAPDASFRYTSPEGSRRPTTQFGVAQPQPTPIATAWGIATWNAQTGRWEFADGSSPITPPPPPHVEQPSPSLNPFAALGRLISGVNVPPALVGMARGVLVAALVAALEAGVADLKGAHLPVEYAAIMPLVFLAARSIEGALDSWGKG